MKDLRSPYVCMILVIVMYAIKITLKLYAGFSTNSVSISSDAIHNIADIIEAGFLIFVIYISRKPESREYPLGKTSVESIGSFLIGIVILIVGAGFLFKSVLGLIVSFDITPQLSSLLQHIVSIPPRIDLGENPMIIFAVIVISIVISWLIAWYEITTGRKKNHPSLIADGRETLMDSFIEIAILIGLIGSFFGMFYLDYVAGVVVSLFMLYTAYVVLSESVGNLLQKSVGQDALLHIERILDSTKGVEGFPKEGPGAIQAFKLGKFIFVSVRIYVSPFMSSEGFYLLKKGINGQIAEALPRYEVKIYLRGDVVPEKPGRVIIPVANTMPDPLDAFIEERFSKAKSFYIVDLKGDRIVTVHEEKNTYKTPEELEGFIRRKMVDTVYFVKEEDGLDFPDVAFVKTHFLIFRDLFH